MTYWFVVVPGCAGRCCPGFGGFAATWAYVIFSSDSMTLALWLCPVALDGGAVRDCIILSCVSSVAGGFWLPWYPASSGS
eukprot:8268364-Prorocentrum_lima.AAC.1